MEKRCEWEAEHVGGDDELVVAVAEQTHDGLWTSVNGEAV